MDPLDNLVAHALSGAEAELESDKGQGFDARRKAVRAGTVQADRGEAVDGGAVMARLRDKLEAARTRPT